MALGGGKWLFQNKIIPGAYINVISKGLASVRLSDRGVSAVPIISDWGQDGKVFKVESGEFQTDSMELFGYEYTSPKLKYIREIFQHGQTVYFYRINSGEKAENDLARAKHSGIRGNDLKIIVEVDPDDETGFVVETLLDLRVVDTQKVKTADELVDNQYVEFIATTLTVNVGKPLANGSNSTEVKGADYQEFLDKIDGLSFNTLACPTADDLIKNLFFNFTTRMRDEVGGFFQTVMYDNENKYDHEGIITVANECISDDSYAGVYWLTGAESSVEVNKTLSNDTYNGELEFDTDYKQSELEELIEDGRLVFHTVGEEVRILLDINNFTSFSDDKQEEFRNNQVVRVFDGLGLELALIFNNKYNGHIPNDTAGRESFWSDIVDINRQYEDIRAIEDFDSSELEVYEGRHDGAVVVNNPVNVTTAMTHLYATIILKD